MIVEHLIIYGNLISFLFIGYIFISCLLDRIEKAYSQYLEKKLLHGFGLERMKTMLHCAKDYPGYVVSCDTDKNIISVDLKKPEPKKEKGADYRPPVGGTKK